MWPLFSQLYNATKASGIMLVFPMLQIGFSLPFPASRPSLIDNDVACYVHRSIKMHIFILPDPHISFYMMMASLSKEVKSCVTNHDLDFTRWDTGYNYVECSSLALARLLALEHLRLLHPSNLIILQNNEVSIFYKIMRFQYSTSLFWQIITLNILLKSHYFVK